MKNKKKEINLTIILFAFTAASSFLFWYFKETYSAFEFLFALSSGICGSSFATLCIFISNYRAEKEKLLQAIFAEGVYINNHLPRLEEYDVEQAKMEEYLENKTYISSIADRPFTLMTNEEKTFYNLCRYVDSFLDLCPDRLQKFWDDINEIDFWTDPIELSYSSKICKWLPWVWNINRKLIKKSKAYQIERKFFPIYSILISPCSAQDQYIFYSFYYYKFDNKRSAIDIYRFVKNLDHKISGPCPEIEWPDSKSQCLRTYLHETLWIFRDAFSTSSSDRKEAFKAFMTGSKYTHIR